MSLSHKTTLLQEADVDAVQTYIDTLMSSHRDSVTKREALVYLKRILNSDSAVVRELQSKLTLPPPRQNGDTVVPPPSLPSLSFFSLQDTHARYSLEMSRGYDRRAPSVHIRIERAQVAALR